MNARPDYITARTVEHAIALQKQRGKREAAIFMLVHGVPFQAIVRVVSEPKKRRARA